MRRHIARLRAMGVWNSLKYLIITVGLQRLGVRIDQVYISAEDLPSPSDLPMATIHRDILSFSIDDTAALNGYGQSLLLDEFPKAFKRGEICVAGRARDGSLACVCWVRPHVSHRVLKIDDCTTIERCFTLPQYRGAGIYPHTLRCAQHFARATFGGNRVIVIESSIGNSASMRGIEKSGFRPVGKAFRIGRVEFGLARIS